MVPSVKAVSVLVAVWAAVSTTVLSRSVLVEAGSSSSSSKSGKGKGRSDYYSACLTVESKTKQFGSWFSPVWVGIHNGGFDWFNVGEKAENWTQAIAEFSDFSLLREQFSSDPSANIFQTSTGGNEIAPGEDRETCFSIDEDEFETGNDLYVSYAAAFLPSNDAFIGNNNPTQFKIYDSSDDELEDMYYCVNEVLDAGTEENSEFWPGTNFVREPQTGAREEEDGVITGTFQYRTDLAEATESGVRNLAAFRNADASGEVVCIELEWKDKKSSKSSKSGSKSDKSDKSSKSSKSRRKKKRFLRRLPEQENYDRLVV